MQPDGNKWPAPPPPQMPPPPTPSPPADERLPVPEGRRTRARRQAATAPPKDVNLADRILWRNVFAFGALIIMGAITFVMLVLVVFAVFHQYARFNAIQDAYNQQYICQIRGTC